MRTLIIHPIDSSTDFLCPIYANIECDVIRNHPRGNISNETLNNYDRIIMLGHGTEDGLLHTQDFGYLLDEDNVIALKDKILVGIWCNADKFFEDNNLNGLYTGMIISEKLEALFELPQYHISTKEIKESNKLFTDVITDLVSQYSNGVLNESEFNYENFREKIDIKYPPISPLMKFNNNRIYFKT